MTNTEKALETAKANYCRYYIEIAPNVVKEKTSERECYDSALEMAKFKDQQFIKFIEDRMGDEISVKMIEEFKEMIK